MDAALHDGEGDAGEAAEDQAARVAFDGGAGEVREFGVGDRNRVCKPVGESSEAGTEDDGDLRLGKLGPERSALADEGGGSLGLDKCRFWC
jgi:hypothetical protein